MLNEEISSKPSDSEKEIHMQKIVLLCFFTYPFIFNQAVKNIDMSFFSDPSCQFVYKSILGYYNEEHKKDPIKRKYILSSMKGENIPDSTTIKDVKNLISSISSMTIPTYDEAKNQTEKIIRTWKIKRAIEKTRRRLEDPDISNEDFDSIVDDMFEAKDFSFERYSAENTYSISSSFMSLNEAFHSNGYIIGSLNLVLSPPNIGKTTLLINEGVHAAIQGHHILHVFLGDLTRDEGEERYNRCVSAVLNKRNDSAQFIEFHEGNDSKDEKREIMRRIHIASFATKKKTVKDIVEYVKRHQRKYHYDMVIVDSIDNLSRCCEKESMYRENGTIYSNLSQLARYNGSVLLLSENPRAEYWKSEIMPMVSIYNLLDLGLLDTILCFNKQEVRYNIGTIHIAKMRSGPTGGNIRVRTEFEHFRILEISEEEYKDECLKFGMYPAMCYRKEENFRF